MIEKRMIRNKSTDCHKLFSLEIISTPFSFGDKFSGSGGHFHIFVTTSIKLFADLNTLKRGCDCHGEPPFG
jgi:hypothetical protein